MSDIVERLQAVVDHWQVVDASKLCAEAKREIERLTAEALAERERCALKAYREIIAAVDDVRLANTIRDAIREGEL